jgi:hypothetical protein
MAAVAEWQRLGGSSEGLLTTEAEALVGDGLALLRVPWEEPLPMEASEADCCSPGPVGVARPDAVSAAFNRFKKSTMFCLWPTFLRSSWLSTRVRPWCSMPFCAWSISISRSIFSSLRHALTGSSLSDGIVQSSSVSGAAFLCGGGGGIEGDGLAAVAPGLSRERLLLPALLLLPEG